MWWGTRRKRSISLASTATYCWSPLALKIKTPTPLSVQALQEKESKQERSDFISSCCFTCTTQLQAPVEMCAAPQKYHFQVERHTFPWLRVGSAPLLYFVFRGQIDSAHNLNILEKWSHLTSVCSICILLNQTLLVLGHFGYLSRPLRKESAALKTHGRSAQQIETQPLETCIILIYIYLTKKEIMNSCSGRW